MSDRKIVIDIKQADMHCHRPSFNGGMEVDSIAIPTDNILYVLMQKNGSLKILLKDEKGYFLLNNKEVAKKIYQDYTSNAEDM